MITSLKRASPPPRMGLQSRGQRARAINTFTPWRRLTQLCAGPCASHAHSAKGYAHNRGAGHTVRRLSVFEVRLRHSILFCIRGLVAAVRFETVLEHRKELQGLLDAFLLCRVQEVARLLLLKPRFGVRDRLREELGLLIVLFTGRGAGRGVNTRGVVVEGPAGDGWGWLGMAGDGWGWLGTAGDPGDGPVSCVTVGLHL